MEKKNKNDITVILPIHELNGDSEIKLFKTALESVEKQKVTVDELLIVYPKGSEVEEILNNLELKDYNTNIRLVANEGKSDFASQLNHGVKECKTEWFSTLEFDDEYSINWFKNVKTYIESHSDVDLFLPITINANTDGDFIGLSNEAVWANSFSTELGILDNEVLMDFEGFNTNGMVFKKSKYEEFGGMKSNIKVYFNYEFLLRMTFKGVKLMIIPKYGYKHLNGREGSLFKSYETEIDVVEARWWLSQARKDYFFPNERDITYAPK